MVQPFTSNKAFTLIELLIVIAVLGIMAAALVLILNPITQFQKARDARRKSDLREITTWLNTYYNDNNRYPPAGTCGYGGEYCYVYSTSGTSWIPALVPNYAVQLPVDPLNKGGGPWATGNYTYAYGNVSADGQHYDLVTQLEYQNDPQICGVQNYMRLYGWISSGQPWCGSFSNYIYAVDQ